MASSTAVYGIAIVFGFIYFVNLLVAHRRLSHIKGPWLAGWSRLWMLRATLRWTLYSDLADACKRYGSIARIAPDTVVTNDPDIVKRMSAARSPYRKGQWYAATAISHDVDHIFSEIDERRHNDRRSRMAAGYSGRDLPCLEECVDNRLKDFYRLILEKYTSSGPKLRPVDFAQKLQYLVIDIITDMACGEPFGFLSADQDVHGYIATQMQLIPLFEWLSTLPSLDRLLRIPFISKASMPKPTDKTGIGRVLGVAQRTVSKRFGPEKTEKQDMIGSWVQHGLSQKQIEVEAVLQVIAGSDSTVTAIRTITFFIITHPTIYRALQSEIDTATSSLPNDTIIREEVAKTLPYLQACLREGLRLHPPVTALATKIVPPEGDTLKGRFIPGGTSVIYAAWDFYKDKDTFGEDVDVYRPERWLEAQGEKLKLMEQTLDLVFGHGKYGCLGKPVAWLELNKVIAELFRRYDIELINPQKPWKSYNRNGFFFQSDMWVRVTERKK